MDFVDRATRSRIMGRVPAKNTKPELALRRVLHGRGLRYRVHVRKLPGTPDIVFSRFMAVCFVHGCFWHRHVGCHRMSHPSRGRVFWEEKFRRNVERDQTVRSELLENGWRVEIVWECALSAARIEETAQLFDEWLRGTELEFETAPGRTSARV